jgi:hypothetical protein
MTDALALAMPQEPLEFDFTAYLARRLDASPEAIDGVLGRVLVDSQNDHPRVTPAKSRPVRQGEACA